MVTNDELLKEIELLGTRFASSYEELNRMVEGQGMRILALTEAYTQMVDHITGKKKPKAVIPEVIITQEGHGIEKPVELPKHIPNLDMERKHKINKTPCNKCDGLFTWDYYKPDFKMAVHVDNEGKIIGKGECPNYAS